MRHTLLLRHSGKLLGIVAFAPITDHHPGIIGRDQLPDFLVAMLAANLIHRRLVGVETHQKRALTTHPPAGVVGVYHRRCRHTGT